MWTADVGGTPKAKVKLTDANPYGVLVSPFARVGTDATVTVESGRLTPGVNYVLRTSAYDGSMYETSWSPWGMFRIELPVDLALPAPVYTAPQPGFTTEPDSRQTKPKQPGPLARSTYKAEKQCGPKDKAGRQACIAPTPAEPAKPRGTRDVGWCGPGTMGAYADRYKQCDKRPCSPSLEAR
ncbi:hypothetical protein ACWF94_13160 [Streptomyces sp. NPDC055078]